MDDDLTPRDRQYRDVEASGAYLSFDLRQRAPWWRRLRWRVRELRRLLVDRYMRWRHPRWLAMMPELSDEQTGAAVLWHPWRGGAALYLDDLPLSPDLIGDLTAWTFEYDREVWHDPDIERTNPDYWADFIQRGHVLHERVRRDLGPEWRVDWRDPWPT